MTNFFVGNGNFDPTSNEQQKDLINWLYKQPVDKIDDYSWEVLKPFYREKPVDWIQFLYDKKYMGNLFYNNGKSAIYPYWVNVGCTCYPKWFYQAYQLLLMSLAIGVGKSTFMNAIALYNSHLLGCLNNPADFYGLLKTETIVMAFFSTTKDLLYTVNWPKFSEALMISPWFKKRLNLDETAPKVKSLDLFDNFAVQLGTRTQHAISRDVLIALIDEGNQQITSDQVEKNFNELMKRRESRFQNGLSVPGIVVVGSSPQGPDDFIFRTIKQYKKDPTCLVLNDVSEWEVKQGAKYYCGKTFKIFIGDNKTQDARIIASNENTENLDQTLIREVPIEYYKEFETDLTGSIRDKLGLRSTKTTAWFKSRQAIAEAVTLPNLLKPNIPELDTIELSVFDSYKSIVELTDLNVLKTLVDIGLPYYIGLDYGYNHDKFGFALATNIKVLKEDHYDRQFKVPCAIAFKAKDSRGVPSSAVENYIDWLRGEGLNIQLITSDKPGTVTLQNLIIKGFKTEYLSVDTSKDPYTIVRTLVYNKHIELPYNDLMVTEFSNLQDVDNKVDHPKNMTHHNKTIEGSKDTADAITQAVYKAYLGLPFETSEEFVDNTSKLLESIKQQQYINSIKQQNFIQNQSIESFMPNQFGGYNNSDGFMPRFHL